MRDLVPAAHPRQQSDVEFAEQAVQDGTVRFQIETFHVDQAAVTGRHQHRNPAGLCTLAHQGLHVQRVALLDDDVESVEELVDGVVGQSGVEHPDRQVGVQFGDASSRDRRLVHPEIEQRGRDPVQVGQFEAVEVGQPQLADQALSGERVGDDVADAQPCDADPQSAEAFLLCRRDHVAVAVESHRAETRGPSTATTVRRHG